MTEREEKNIDHNVNIFQFEQYVILEILYANKLGKCL